MAEQLISRPLMGEVATDGMMPLDTEGPFSFGEARAIVDHGEGYYIPIDDWGRQLSPMETGTDVVLPVLSLSHTHKDPDYHHAYFYERHYKQGSPAIRAVRTSRLQRVKIPDHKSYHDSFFGTMMPPDESAAAKAIILNSAGYVARMGVVIQGGEITIRELSKQERNRLRNPNVFRLEKSKGDRAKLGVFLMEYALKQEFTSDEQKQIERLLELTLKNRRNPRDRAERLRLGLRLTNIAIGMAVEPVEPDYREARNRYALRTGEPITAWHAVKKLLKGREVDYLPTLEDQLIDRHLAVA